MATTPTYSWPIPDDTDLVKDGAEAIRDLGNAIDTTISSTTGLVHIETQAFNAVSGVNFSNDVFTSTYDSYKIVFVKESTSTNNNVTFRLRAAGSDISTSNYAVQTLLADQAIVQGAQATGTGPSLQGGDRRATRIILEIANPKKALRTYISSHALDDFNDSQSTLNFKYTMFNLTTSVDSCSFIASTGNMTGYASLYGYRK